MLKELHERSINAGLEINMTKTNIITNTEDENIDIEINNNIMKAKEDVIYLGQIISAKIDTKKR